MPKLSKKNQKKLTKRNLSNKKIKKSRRKSRKSRRKSRRKSKKRVLRGGANFARYWQRLLQTFNIYTLPNKYTEISNNNYEDYLGYHEYNIDETIDCGVNPLIVYYQGWKDDTSDSGMGGHVIPPQIHPKFNYDFNKNKHLAVYHVILHPKVMHLSLLIECNGELYSIGLGYHAYEYLNKMNEPEFFKTPIATLISPDITHLHDPKKESKTLIACLAMGIFTDIMFSKINEYLNSTYLGAFNRNKGKGGRFQDLLNVNDKIKEISQLIQNDIIRYRAEAPEPINPDNPEQKGFHFPGFGSSCETTKTNLSKMEYKEDLQKYLRDQGFNDKAIEQFLKEHNNISNILLLQPDKYRYDMFHGDTGHIINCSSFIQSIINSGFHINPNTDNAYFDCTTIFGGFNVPYFCSNPHRDPSHIIVFKLGNNPCNTIKKTLRLFIHNFLKMKIEELKATLEQLKINAAIFFARIYGFITGEAEIGLPSELNLENLENLNNLLASDYTLFSNVEFYIQIIVTQVIPPRFKEKIKQFHENLPTETEKTVGQILREIIDPSENENVCEEKIGRPFLKEVNDIINSNYLQILEDAQRLYQFANIDKKLGRNLNFNEDPNQPKSKTKATIVLESTAPKSVLESTAPKRKLVPTFSATAPATSSATSLATSSAAPSPSPSPLPFPFRFGQPPATADQEPNRISEQESNRNSEQESVNGPPPKKKGRR